MTYDSSAVTRTPASPLPALTDVGLDKLYAKVTRRLIPFLLLCFVGAFLDRVNISFAKLQMSSDLGFSETTYGIGAGIFFLGYFLFEVPSNILLHRIGARIWIARIMITWAILSAAVMFVRTPASFYVLRFLLGAAEAGFFPGVILYLSRWYPSARRGKVIALFMIGFPLASIIGGPLSGWIMQGLHGAFGLAGWKWLFLIEAVPSLILGVATMFYLTERIADAKWLDEQERRVLTDALSQERVEAQRTSIAGALTDWRMWYLGAILFLIGLGMYGLVFWLPTLIKLSGISHPLQIGLLSAGPNIAGAIAMVTLGRSADRRRERRWHIALSGFVGALGLAGAALWPDQTFVAMIAICVAAIGIFPAAPVFGGIPARLLGGAGAAAGIAMINSIGNLAGFFAPAFFGWIKDATHSTMAGLLAFAFALCVSAILVLLLPRHIANR
ncbi:MFS transporter [Burkholderia sp. CCA53]|uniref:MFS transporter n=1 Tax=Burkholderia sp. CCA53 TaxID=1776288 RepID=UPI0009F1A2F4|nr:MFS transporter [Burkholderia sp. CCA53]